MITAVIDVNPVSNLDPFGTVEVRLPINKVDDAATQIRSIKETEPIPYFKELVKVDGFVSGEVSFEGIVYRVNSLDDLEEVKANAKQSRSSRK